jgi:hypothetical protein
VMLVGLFDVSEHEHLTNCSQSNTYKWNTAVCAHAYLGFINVDEDLGVS